jgi:hypothetical protein
MLVLVVMLRSQRLEALLGGRLDDLTAARVHGLVTGQVSEEFDLDFKEAHHGRGDSDRRSLAGDVAALANTAGGVIILGVAEDDHARAVAAPGVDLSDAEVARIRQVVAALTAPMPYLDILLMPDSSLGDGRGFLILAVPRSVAAPHAVLVNDALRYPVRNGATTRYLSEAEVATAYRRRLAGVANQEQRLAELEAIAQDSLERDDARILVALVPDLAGDMTIAPETYAAFQIRMVGTPITIVPTFATVGRTGVGQRCFLADDAAQRGAPARTGAMRFATDGSGTFAHRLHHISNGQQGRRGLGEGDTRLVWDELLVLAVLSGLHRLGHHARDQAAAGGHASVRVTLDPRDRSTEIGHTRHYGVAESRSTRAIDRPVQSDPVSVPLDTLATPGPDLMAITAALSNEIAQAFGVIDLGQIDAAGAVQPNYWSNAWRTSLVEWSLSNDVPVLGT